MRKNNGSVYAGDDSCNVITGVAKGFLRAPWLWPKKKKRSPGLLCIGSRLQGTRINISVWAPRKEEPWSLGFEAKSPGLQGILHFGTLIDVYALYLHLLLIGFIRKKLAHAHNVMYADQSE